MGRTEINVVKQMKSIAIIILNWNNKVLTDVCIRSLKSQSYKNYNIFVVDNNSSDDSLPYLRRKYKDVKIIKNESNLGYAAGNNVGIKEAIRCGYEYIYILNNDVELLPHSLELLINLLKTNKNIGVVAPITLSYFENRKSTKTRSFFGDYNFLFGNFNFYRINGNEPIRAKLAVGCALLFKSEVFRKCGLFEEKYYMYMEEFDLLTRVSNYGFSLFVHPLAIVYLREGSSSRLSSFPKSYYLLRNQLLFNKEHSSPAVFICYSTYFIIKLPFFLFRARNIRDLRLHLVGIRDFLGSRYYKSEITRNTSGFFH